MKSRAVLMEPFKEKYRKDVDAAISKLGGELQLSWLYMETGTALESAWHLKVGRHADSLFPATIGAARAANITRRVTTYGIATDGISRGITAVSRRLQRHVDVVHFDFDGHVVQPIIVRVLGNGVLGRTGFVIVNAIRGRLGGGSDANRIESYCLAIQVGGYDLIDSVTGQYHNGSGNQYHIWIVARVQKKGS